MGFGGQTYPCPKNLETALRRRRLLSWPNATMSCWSVNQPGPKCCVFQDSKSSRRTRCWYPVKKSGVFLRRRCPPTPWSKLENCCKADRPCSCSLLLTLLELLAAILVLAELLNGENFLNSEEQFWQSSTGHQTQHLASMLESFRFHRFIQQLNLAVSVDFKQLQHFLHWTLQISLIFAVNPTQLWLDDSSDKSRLFRRSPCIVSRHRRRSSGWNRSFE